jgi:hypothetical protein
VTAVLFRVAYEQDFPRLEADWLVFLDSFLRRHTVQGLQRLAKNLKTVEFGKSEVVAGKFHGLLDLTAETRFDGEDVNDRKAHIGKESDVIKSTTLSTKVSIVDIDMSERTSKSVKVMVTAKTVSTIQNTRRIQDNLQGIVTNVEKKVEDLKFHEIELEFLSGVSIDRKKVFVGPPVAFWRESELYRSLIPDGKLIALKSADDDPDDRDFLACTAGVTGSTGTKSLRWWRAQVAIDPSLQDIWFASERSTGHLREVVWCPRVQCGSEPKVIQTS